MSKGKRLVIYTRVSTGEQTTANQVDELAAWAERSGHTVVKVYEDKGISGSKGRDKRPAFDAMLKGAVRREFDMTGIGLYIHTQALDTTTPAGRAMFGMLAVFGEFEREMIVARVNAGLARARQSGTKSGKAIGRPKGADYDVDAIRGALLQGRSVREVVRETGASIGTTAAVRKELVEEGAL